jgi:hypothetical protein
VSRSRSRAAPGGRLLDLIAVTLTRDQPGVRYLLCSSILISIVLYGFHVDRT